MDFLPHEFTDAVLARFHSLNLRKIGDVHYHYPENFALAARRILGSRFICDVRFRTNASRDPSFTATVDRWTPSGYKNVDAPPGINQVDVLNLTASELKGQKCVEFCLERTMQLMLSARLRYLDCVEDSNSRPLMKYAISDDRIGKYINYLVLPYDFSCPTLIQLLYAAINSKKLEVLCFRMRGDERFDYQPRPWLDEEPPMEHQKALLNLYYQPQFHRLEMETVDHGWCDHFLKTLMWNRLNGLQPSPLSGKGFALRFSPPFQLFGDYDLERVKFEYPFGRCFLATHREKGFTVWLGAYVDKARSNSPLHSLFGSMTDEHFLELTQLSEVFFCPSHCHHSHTPAPPIPHPLSPLMTPIFVLLVVLVIAVIIAMY